MTPPKAPLTGAALEGLERAAGGCAPAHRVVEMRIEDVLALLAEVREARAAVCDEQGPGNMTVRCVLGRNHGGPHRARNETIWTTVPDPLARELAQALEGACAEIGRHYEMGPYESPWLKLRARARAAGLLDPEGG